MLVLILCYSNALIMTEYCLSVFVNNKYALARMMFLEMREKSVHDRAFSTILAIPFHQGMINLENDEVVYVLENHGLGIIEVIFL